MLRLACCSASNVAYDYRSDADAWHRVAPFFRLLPARQGLSRSLAFQWGWFAVLAQELPGQFIPGGEDSNTTTNGEGSYRARKEDAPGPWGGPGAGGERGYGPNKLFQLSR